VTRGSHTPLFNHSEPGQRSTHHGEANGILTVHPRGLPNRGLTNGPVTEFHGLKLYPFQSQAVEALEKDHSVIVAAPTGAGKTIVAEFAIEKALQEGVRVAYTSPVKALSNQKFRNFREIYPGKVGIMTGDVTIDADAPILIMTTEVFRNTLFEDESRLRGIRYVVFDEVHFLDDPERGTVWEESIIFAPPDVRFVFLSATISNLREFSAWIQKVRPDTHLEVVHSDERPVPLRHFLFFPEYGVVSWTACPSSTSRSAARIASTSRLVTVTSICCAPRKPIGSPRSSTSLPSGTRSMACGSSRSWGAWSSVAWPSITPACCPPSRRSWSGCSPPASSSSSSPPRPSLSA
jgi:hypothetical protein